jgi:hypothetical protein
MDKKWLKDNRSFLLCLIGTLGVLGLAYTKDTNIDLLLPTVIGIYVTGRTSQKISAHYNARHDEDADVVDIIKSLDNQIDDKKQS